MNYRDNVLVPSTMDLTFLQATCPDVDESGSSMRMAATATTVAVTIGGPLW